MLAARRRREQLDRSHRSTIFQIGDQTFDNMDIDEYFRRASEYTPTKPPPSPSPSLVAAITCSTPPALQDLDRLRDPEVALEGEIENDIATGHYGYTGTPMWVHQNHPSGQNTAHYYFPAIPWMEHISRPLSAPEEFETSERALKTLKDYFLCLLRPRRKRTTARYSGLEYVGLADLEYTEILRRLREYEDVISLLFGGSQTNSLWMRHLVSCFSKVEMGRKVEAVTELRKACDGMENVSPELGILDIYCLVVLFSIYREEPVLEFRNFFLNFIRNVGMHSINPRVRALGEWSSEAMKCRQMQTLLHELLRLIPDILRIWKDFRADYIASTRELSSVVVRNTSSLGAENILHSERDSAIQEIADRFSKVELFFQHMERYFATTPTSLETGTRSRWPSSYHHTTISNPNQPSQVSEEIS